MSDYAPDNGTQQDTAVNTTGDQTPAAVQVVTSPADKALIQKILKTIKRDKIHHKKAFERMRRDMGIALRGYDEKNWSDRKYHANICGRHVKQKTAQLYAKNPKIVAKRREMLDFVVWDENPDTLKLAMQTTQMAAQQNALEAQQPPQIDPVTGGPAPLPPPPPGLDQANAIIADFQQGTMLRQTAVKTGKTLELLFAYSLEQQRPVSFKQSMKQCVRRATTTGVAYVELGYQRQMGPRQGLTEQLTDARQRLDHLQKLFEDMQEGEIEQDDPEMAELTAMVKAYENEPQVVLREGMTFDFPRSTKVIPDRLCTMLEGFIGARHVSIEYLYTKDQIKELFKVDLKDDDYCSYSGEGKDDERATRKLPNVNEDDDTGTGLKQKEGLVCVWKHYDKTAGLVYFVADGYSAWLQAPAEPEVYVDDFWPLFPLTFNAVENEKELFPISDVSLLKSMQEEYNQSRQGAREHRKAARPRWGYNKGAFDEGDISELKSLEPFDVVGLNIAPGSKLADLLQSIPVPGVDPNLYTTNEIFTDTQLVVGSQAATLGGISQATATETSVAANSMASADGSSIDDLDALLTRIAQAGAQIFFREMNEDQVKKICGPGAVWPVLEQSDICDQVTLEIQAGSTGKPNQGVEINNWKGMLPFLLQIPCVSPMWLARESVRRLDDNADLTEAITEGIPSIVAQNALQAAPPGQPPGGQVQPGTGNPATDPKAQGAHGAQNGPQAPANPSGGSGAHFGSNQV